MKSDYILEILSTAPALTITQLATSLRFLDMDTKFSSLHCFRMSIYQSLRFLMKEDFATRTEIDMKDRPSKYQITQRGFEYLQSLDNLEVVKKVIERVI
jgi:DNA-binding PadR family transcriptional regulator